MSVPMHDDTHLDLAAQRWVAQAAVGGLEGAAWLIWAGLVLALINVLLAGTLSPAGQVYLILGIVAALLGALQLWLLVRVAIDRRLFGALADPSQQGEHADMAAMLGAMDQALVRLGWARPEAGGRSLAQRARGALRWLHWAAALAALQLLVALLILLLR